jgi:hypothetical protein
MAAESGAAGVEQHRRNTTVRCIKMNRDPILWPPDNYDNTHPHRLTIAHHRTGGGVTGPDSKQHVSTHKESCMIPFRALSTMVAALTVFLGACSSNTSNNGAGGSVGTGGKGTGGGAFGSGGATAAGGRTGAGGTAATGGGTGLPNSGGQAGGGATNSGGSSAAGGTTGNGGKSGSGGLNTAGGTSGRDAGSSVGTGGVGGGGTLGQGGASVPDVDGGPRQAAYYVSPTGSDTNPGTASAPFQTITKARDVVRTINTNMTGDIYVYLRGGDYRITSPITFESKDSGTGNHRIYYQAYPGETPVINGATKVTGWTVSSGSVYKATLDRKTKLRNLYVNDARANMTSKSISSKGGSGTYSVTAGQAAWAWNSGSGSDGIKYGASDIPDMTTNKDDLEIVNGTTWNENIVCSRDVTTASDGSKVVLLQQPYGIIAQLPGWNSGFNISGSHKVFNAFAWLNSPGQYYFDKTTGTLYYYPRSGEDMSTADVEAPVAQSLISIAGTSNNDRVKNITIQGITFANTDYNLVNIGNSYGKASVQGATAFIAYGSGDWHASKYQITDTFPGMIMVNSADSINIIGNVIKHSGNEGVSMINDVINSNVIGNYITDMAGSGMTIGHPQHVYIGDGGAHEKYAKGVEGACIKDTINNNVVYNVSTLPGFGGHSGITAFFVDTLTITHNLIHSTAYNGINLGWGWRNFTDSTTCKNNTCSFNRFNNMMTRLHDSGAVYTIGQEPGTTINQNYVKGIPPNSSGPTYGLHNDEGSAYITENDNVLDIDKGVTYTINCEDYGAKHDLTILRTYATVNKMGATPPNSKIDTPVVVADAVWPVTQYGYAVASGVEDAYRSIVPNSLALTPDFVFPASCAAPKGTATLPIRSSGNATNTVWFAPAGTTTFAEGATMTKAVGNATSIAVPTTAGSYRLSVVDSQGKKLGESAALLRVQ